MFVHADIKVSNCFQLIETFSSEATFDFCLSYCRRFHVSRINSGTKLFENSSIKPKCLLLTAGRISSCLQLCHRIENVKTYSLKLTREYKIPHVVMLVQRRFRKWKGRNDRSRRSEEKAAIFFQSAERGKISGFVKQYNNLKVKDWRYRQPKKAREMHYNL